MHGGPVVSKSLSVWWVLSAVACGVAFALVVASVAVPGLSLTSPSTVACPRGSELGWSGPVATTLAVSVAPPGGYVRSVFWTQDNATVNQTGNITGTGVSGTWNASTAVVEIFNWTLYAGGGASTGWAGIAEACPVYDLVAGPALGNATPFTWSVLPAASSSPFTFQSITGNFTYEGIPSVSYVGSYSTQIGTFSLSPDRATINLPTSLGISYGWDSQDNGQPANFTFHLSIPASSTGFAVPIHLPSGGSVALPANDAAALPDTEVMHSLAYVFSSANESGSWNVYAAGLGSPESIGGLLFVRTSTETASLSGGVSLGEDA